MRKIAENVFVLKRKCPTSLKKDKLCFLGCNGYSSGFESPKILMLSATTSTLKPGSYLYDVILKDPSGGVTRAVEGTALVKKSVTRI